MPREIVERMLSDPASPVLAGGRRPRPVQARYAQRVLDGLDGDHPLSLIEAETGVGKTIGYIVAALAHAAETGDRVVISTHSIALQTQIMRTLETMGPAMEEIFGRPVRVRKRVGRRNLLCEERFSEAVAAIADRGKVTSDERDVINAITEWFADTPDPPMIQGLEEYLEARFGPEGVASPIAFPELRIGDRERAHPAYLRMARDAETADILVINHALIATDLLLHGRVLALTETAPGDRRTRLIVDEADRLNSAIDSLMSARTPFSEIGSVLRSLSGREGAHPDPDALVAKMERLAARFRARAAHLVTPMAGAGRGIMLNRVMPELRGIRGGIKPLRDLLPLLVQAHEAIKATATRQEDDSLEMADELCGAIDGIRTVLDGDGPSGEVVFYWSEHLERPGLSTRRSDPQLIARRLWNDVDPRFRVVMTSATMTTENTRDLMTDFCKDIGLSEIDLRNGIVRDRISPENFGDMRFMTVNPLQVPNITLQRGKDDEVPPLNPAHAEVMIRLAARLSATGERVLVPIPSYRDVRLYRTLKEEVIASDIGNRLLLDAPSGRGGTWKRFANAPGSILVSPAVWSGLDLPGLVRHILIPRIPFPPTSLITDGLYEAFLRSRGFEEKMIESLRYKKLRARARITLKQGMGRGIRDEDDVTTIWIGDPRWPYPSRVARNPEMSGRMGAGMAAAVPFRFRGAHDEMGVIDLREDAEREPDPA